VFPEVYAPAAAWVSTAVFNSTVTFSIVPVQANGGESVKSTGDAESIPTSRPAQMETFTGIVAIDALRRPSHRSRSS
jgi:hypothetical protein